MRTLRIMDFAVPADYRVKVKEIEKKDKYLDFVRELKNTLEYENDDNTNCIWCFWYNQQRISTRNGGLGNKRTSGDHPNDCIIEIGQNTEKSPGDLLSLKLQRETID